ncbi:MAG: CBS domain-containing protein [Candidatus Hadarchaeales archaeon]
MAQKRKLNQLDILRKTKVGDVMDRSPILITPETPLKKVMAHIRRGKEFFPVVDKEKRLLGVLSESDIFRLFMPRRRIATVGAPEIKEISVVQTADDVMTKKPISIDPESTLLEAIQLMAFYKFRHLPVVKKGKIVGVLSLRDILKKI